MQLIEVPAKAGYVWFRQGIWLFRRNPLAFVTLFFTYLLAIMLVSLVPVIGAALPLLFIPGVAVGFMAACRDAVAGKPVMPTILVDGFRSYGQVTTQRLFVLGALYVAAMGLVFAASALLDGGVLFGMMMGAGSNATPDALAAQGMNGIGALLVATALYVPVSMLFWFAPVLTAWHDIPPVKALFFSIVSCWRNRGAFLVYGLLWFGVAIGTSVTLSLLLQALGADMNTGAVAVMMLATIVILTMLYCSFYATYRGCYGVQEKNSPEESKT
ncbi:BPSS1780 family membrane protein [Burkholderia guangdongensis]|uniref:BPSS1780 family membrane protein n=1 Tax=Burkholderia guangdongensis TaxID=1792500 RepID=UPI0015C7980A|nr:BPSS1780 family membrane protein [Burkholderia guangdongensis]